MKLTHSILKKLPKAELHCHLDGSLRIDTIIDLANKQKIKLPSHNSDSLRSILEIGTNISNLEDYLSRFQITLSVMQTPNSLIRTSYELGEDCWNDGIRYLEIRYSPILHTKHGMTLAETVKAVKQGLKKAENDFGIQTGIIICGIRNISPEISLQLANLTLQFKNQGVVGFDLAGAEENFPAKHHHAAFALILKNNINTTLHAGEAYGPESIHQAIHTCGAHRIGHGTRLKENLDLMQYINDHRIPLEICLKSNIHTGTIETLQKHPFKYYLENNLRVTINTDNRLISSTTLTDEYWTAKEIFNLNQNDIRNIIINGFKSAFLPHTRRIELIKEIVRELESEFQFDDRIII